MCRKLDPAEFSKPDLRLFGESKKTEETAFKYLRDLQRDVDSIRISPYLHFDAEEYIHRVLNTFLYGWYHYPLFTVADTLSYFALELALRRRFEYQVGRRKRFLRHLFARAISEGLLKFEQTEAVKTIHMNSQEMTRWEIPLLKERDIKDIATNRANLIKDILPRIRGNRVHPDSTRLMMPFSALKGISQIIEYINILYENSDVTLRRISRDIEFDWGNAILYPQPEKATISIEREPIFDNCTEISIAQVEYLITEISTFLCLDKQLNYADQLWIQNRMGILPSKPYDALYQILCRNKKDQPNVFEEKELVEGIQWINTYYSNLLSQFCFTYNIYSPTGNLSFSLDVVASDNKAWHVVGTGAGKEISAQIHNRELSFYLLMRLGFWASQGKHGHWGLKTLSKIIGGV